MSATTADARSRDSSRSLWIVDARHDLLLIVATPLIVILAVTLAQRWFSADEITNFALVCAIGHHLPGMMRAYGDRELFQRFRTRFLAVPLLLVGVAAACSVAELKSVIFLAALWGWWHYLAQTYGFLRIYDGKVGQASAATRWLDKAMCIVWFAAAAVAARNGLPTFLDLYYKCGGPPIAAETVAGVRGAAIGAAALVTLIFLIHAGWSWFAGRPPSPVKLLLMAGTFAFYWYSLETVENILVAYALFELFHDIQYLTIVWVFNRARAGRARDAGAFTLFLFRQRGWLVVLYVVLVLAYGALNYGTTRLEEGRVKQVLVGLFLASTLLHYYYDGFIWRLRERATRQSLDLADDAQAPGRQAGAPGAWKHTLPWGGFLGAVLTLGWMQSRPGLSSVQRWEAIAGAVPDNAQAHFNLGESLERSGELARAAEEYRGALAIKADYDKAHYNLAGVMARRGDPSQAAAHYEAAIRLRPRYAAAYNNLGAVQLGRYRFAEALSAFEAALACEPLNHGFAGNLATAHFHLARQLQVAGRLEEARRHCRDAKRFNPGDAGLTRQIADLESQL